MDARATMCCHGRVRFELLTQASPEQVRRALTDFSDRRLRTWDRTLDPQTYELRDQGDSWALARESTPGSPFWVVARYDWSDPDVVRWTVTESSYGGGGEGSVRTSPLGNGGSRVKVEWSYTNAPWPHKVVLFLIQHRPMSLLISRMWASALNRFALADTR
jgi:hypothetical protein